MTEDDSAVESNAYGSSRAAPYADYDESGADVGESGVRSRLKMTHRGESQLDGQKRASLVEEPGLPHGIIVSGQPKSPGKAGRVFDLSRFTKAVPLLLALGIGLYIGQLVDPGEPVLPVARGVNRPTASALPQLASGSSITEAVRDAEALFVDCYGDGEDLPERVALSLLVGKDGAPIVVAKNSPSVADCVAGKLDSFRYPNIKRGSRATIVMTPSQDASILLKVEEQSAERAGDVASGTPPILSEF